MKHLSKYALHVSGHRKANQTHENSGPWQEIHYFTRKKKLWSIIEQSQSWEIYMETSSSWIINCRSRFLGSFTPWGMLQMHSLPKRKERRTYLLRDENVWAGFMLPSRRSESEKEKERLPVKRWVCSRDLLWATNSHVLYHAESLLLKNSIIEGYTCSTACILTDKLETITQKS